MRPVDKNKKIPAKSDLPERIEKSHLGRLMILFFDFYFILIRKLLFLFKRERGNVIIISLHRLGDTVFTIPAIKEIINHYKAYCISIICYPESESIYKFVFKNRVVPLNESNFYLGGRIASADSRKILKMIKPEVIFDLTGAVTSALLIFNSTASQIIGMNDRIFKNIYTHYIRKQRLPHLIDTYLDVVNQVISFERGSEIYQFKKNENKSGKILIHPFAGWKAKEWNFDKFIKLSKILNNNYQVAFIAKEDLLADQIQNDLKELHLELIKTQTIDDLINELKKCSVIISNDSGPIYIASLLGIPTFSIYGPTNPVFSVPFGKHHGFIQKKIECSPDKNKQYCFTDAGRSGCHSFDCMNFLTIDEVLQKLYPFLDRLNIGHKEDITDDKGK